MTKRKRHQSDFKVRVALEALEGEPVEWRVSQIHLNRAAKLSGQSKTGSRQRRRDKG